MKTVLTTSPLDAAAFIKRGGIVAFPTETVYGLGADVFDEQAIAKIFEAKRRPADNPLIAHIGEISHLSLLAAHITVAAKEFIDSFFPGPLTVVVEKAPGVPLIATAGLDTIGVRMPRFDLARQFIAACSHPVVAPSANLSGRPSPTTWQAVYEDLNGAIGCILQGEPTEIGLESTVVDCTGASPVVLRSGAVSLDELRSVVPATRGIEIGNDEAPKSPGLRHRHYSPRARVVLVNDRSNITPEENAAFIGLAAPAARFACQCVCESPSEYAHSLFEFFRECDRSGLSVIYCEAVDETGIGAALMDRVKRACAND